MDDVNAGINSELQNIVEFSEEYDLPINPNKSKALIISSKRNQNKLRYSDIDKIKMDGQIIEYVDQARNLSYQIDRFLTSAPHVSTLDKKSMEH